MNVGWNVARSGSSVLGVGDVAEHGTRLDPRHLDEARERVREGKEEQGRRAGHVEDHRQRPADRVARVGQQIAVSDLATLRAAGGAEV
jgi:hypothetical protein